LLDVMQRPEHPVRIIGTRHGEKLYETLLSREEMAHAEDKGEYYRVPPDLRDLNYGKFVEQGERLISTSEDYNSHNTRRLDVAGMRDMLLKLDYVRALRDGGRAEPVE
jgi:UDP-glucose 4-epimerase